MEGPKAQEKQVPPQKKRPQLLLSIDKSIRQPNEDSKEKQTTMSAQKQGKKSESAFQFKEVMSAGLRDTHYDNYHVFRTFFDLSMKKCNRSYMEDRFCAIPLIKSNDSQEKESFFGIFDGHRTIEVADYLKNNLFPSISSHPLYESNISKAIIESAIKLDSAIIEFTTQRAINGGSTALCAIARNNTIHVLNVGDSVAAVISEEGIKQVNQQHRPNNISEQAKLIEKGALVMQKNGIWRVNGELAISRSFGDSAYKEYITAIPDVYTFEISPTDEYLLLATDGFWDVMSLESTKSAIDRWQSTPGSNIGVENLSSFLVNEASGEITNFKKDNMTVLVIDLKYLSADLPRLQSIAQLD